ncbi:DUF4405 domain-containing protein [Spirosoma taeanense]|uniref:DUF4405 domain-containing protein n=1 Tax=Spirosoma taeanense TaxID=2735870 RepID=A0A6M5Y4Q2_9BACT|nr:DUF4405 domain-containing protein [Spirosoma taeanense]QJW89488.1 DUF4405 domain-containing protein [Spirosoma taeanense]
MKSKHLVSLSVALVFLVLAITGLLIYFGQGTHAVEHIHAWFGILFVTAAVFHIVNNWSSLTAYARERRTGGIRREFVLPAIVAVVFTVGIAANLPVFDKLANAGKNLVRGDRPRGGGPLPQPAVDSIARATEVAYAKAISASDTAALSTVVADKAAVRMPNGTLVSGREAQPGDSSPSDSLSHTVDRAEALDDNVIVVYGTANGAKAGQSFFTHVLKKQENRWQIAAVQMAHP